MKKIVNCNICGEKIAKSACFCPFFGCKRPLVFDTCTSCWKKPKEKEFDE